MASEEPETTQHASASPHTHFKLSALCAFSRIPDEIIALILTIYAEIDPHFYPDRFRVPAVPFAKYGRENSDLTSRLGWIMSTHVCRRWREIALGSPLLWTDITFSLGQEAVTEFLRRCKSLPLLLDVWVAPMGDKLCDTDLDLYISWALQTVQNNLHRAHTLRIIDVPISIRGSDGSWKLPTSAAPLLRTCWFYNIDEILVWPRDIYAGHAPQLTELRIRGVEQFAWGLAAFGAITYLHVEYCSCPSEDDGDESQSAILCLDDMLATLQHLPSLQSLTIIDSIPSSTRSTRLEDMPQPTLSNLSSLYLEDDLSLVAMLTHRIIWPAEATIQLICSPHGHLEQHGIARARTVEVLRDRFTQDVGMMRTRTMSVTYSRKFLHPSHCSIHLWEDGLDFKPPSSPTQPFFRFDVPVALMDGSPNDFLGIFPLNRLSSLSVEIHPSRPGRNRSSEAPGWLKRDPGWRALFKDCLHIRRVRCAGRQVSESLIGALYDDLAERASTPVGALEPTAAHPLPEPSPTHTQWTKPERPLFPLLEQLYVKTIDWSAILNYGTGRSDIPYRYEQEPKTTVELLAYVVAAREVTGHPITTVIAYDDQNPQMDNLSWQEILRNRCSSPSSSVVDSEDDFKLSTLARI